MRTLRTIPFGAWVTAAVLILAAHGPASAATRFPATTWSVKPDRIPAATNPAGLVGPATSATAPATAPAVAAADVLKVKPGLSINLPYRFSRETRLSALSQRYLLSFSKSEDIWELWDLQTGTKIRNGPGKMGLDDVTLSPDGQYLVGTKRPFPKPMVTEVWSTKNPRCVTSIDEPARSTPDILGFAGVSRFIVHHHEIAKDGFVRVYDVTTGKQNAEIPWPRSGTRGHALSAGGGYFVLIADEQIAFYSTDDGHHAGTVEMTEAKRGTYTFSRWDFRQIVFSPDGDEFALLYTTGDQMRIVTCEMATGQQTAEIFPSVKHEPREPELQYLPDGSGWLIYRHVLIDRTAAAAVYTFPVGENLKHARMAASDQLLVVTEEQGPPKGPLSRLFAVQVLTAPKDAIARGTASVKSGGLSEDADLPPLSKLDTSSTAIAATLPDAEPATRPWLVVPAALAPAKVTAAPAIAIQFPENPNVLAAVEPGRFVFTSRESNSVVVQNSRSEMPKMGMQRTTQGFIDRYDLAKGTLDVRVQTPESMELQDASPSGRTILLRTGSQLDRLDVMIQDQKTYKPLAAFRPFADEPIDPRRPPVDPRFSPRSVKTAVMVDDTHVLASSGSTLMLVEVPSCKVIWRGPGGHPIALSPDRKLAASPGNGYCLVFDPLTGKPLGALATLDNGRRAGRINSLAFAPDGSRLVLVLDGDGVRTLRAYDLKTGALCTEVPLPMQVSGKMGPGFELDSPIFFPSPGFVLIRQWLISLDRKVTVWRYEPLNEQGWYRAFHASPVVPFDGAWFLVPRRFKNPITLVNLPLPHDDARKALAQFKDQDLFEWCPGMKVSLNVNVVGDDKFRQEQIAEWTRRLTAMGFQVAENAPAVITANSFLAAGEPIVYQSILDKQLITVTPYSGGWDIRLSVAGKELWKTEYKPNPSGGGASMLLQMQPGETMQQAADRMHPKPSQTSHIELPPACIFKERAIELTPITCKGLVPDDPKAVSPKK